MYRAWAPPEPLQQAAGRCNRDGRLPSGTVIVFDPADSGRPRSDEYRTAVQTGKQFFGPHPLAAPDDSTRCTTTIRHRRRDREPQQVRASVRRLA
ncbi:hypothetical protein [Streptomyces eurythermus]|uniref:hypothetical protein n=1 Tax=Streptomyces eurythermus TaxID=42237 RepID=UPI003F4D15F0